MPNEFVGLHNLGTRIQGEWQAVKWCLGPLLDSIRRPFQQTKGLYQIWREIRPFSRCGECGVWAQRGEYHGNEGKCCSCDHKEEIAAEADALRRLYESETAEDSVWDYIVTSNKRVYELHGYLDGGHCLGCEVIETDSDEEAMKEASMWSQKWDARVVVHRVPAVNMSGVPSHDIWPNEYVLVGEILAKRGIS
jgi:hypothetical protein